MFERFSLGWDRLLPFRQCLGVFVQQVIVEELWLSALASVEIDDSGFREPERPCEKGTAFVKFFEPTGHRQSDLL
jgi:hypothetical protein